MAKIIVITNQKGGCGKTTVTMNLAAYFAINDSKVLVVDGDPQNSAMGWADGADDEKPFPATMCSLAGTTKPHIEIKKFVNDYDYIFIDCPPSISSNFTDSVLLVADLVIVTIIPSPLDIKATPAIEHLIDKVKSINDSLQAYLLVNMCQPNISIGKDAIEALDDFETPKLKTKLHLRTAYRHAALNGSSVLNSKDEKAILEITALAKEILNKLK